MTSNIKGRVLYTIRNLKGIQLCSGKLGTITFYTGQEREPSSMQNYTDQPFSKLKFLPSAIRAISHQTFASTVATVNLSLRSLSALRRLAPASVLGLALLTGCAATGEPMAAKDAEGKVMAASTDPATEEMAPKIPLAELDGQTVYTVLVAEMALTNREYQLGLQFYLNLAKETRDPGAAERAAIVAQMTNRLEEAGEATAIWLESDPDNASAHQTAALAAVRTKDLEKAKFHLTRVLQLSPGAAIDVIIGEPKDYTEEERQTLIDLFNPLAKEYSKNERLWLAKSRLEMANRQFDPALDSVNKSLKIAEGPENYEVKARIYFLMGKNDAGKSTMETALKKFPLNRSLVVFQAQQLARINEADQAIPALKNYFNSKPEDHPITALYARIAYEAEAMEEAQTLYNRLTLVGQFMDEAHYYLGNLAQVEENTQQAIEHFQKITKDPYFVPAAARLVDLVVAEDSVEAGLAEIDRLISEHPDKPDLYAVKSDLYLQENQDQFAYDTLSEGLNQFPENIRLLYNRALLAEQLDNLGQLEIDLNKVLELEPDNASALNALGYTLADRTDRVDEAYDLIKRAYDLRPDDAAIQDSMGWVLYRRGDLEASLEFLQPAFNNTKNHEIAAHLGEVLWQLNRKDEADKVWQEGLLDDPESEVLKRTMDRLKNP